MIEAETQTPAMVARELAQALGERTYAAMCLLVRTVREIGPDAASDLAARALFIEATGGLPLGAPWNRRRTPGGVFFSLLKAELDDDQHVWVFGRRRKAAAVAQDTPEPEPAPALTPTPAKAAAKPKPKKPAPLPDPSRPCAACGDPADVVGKFHFGRAGKQCLCAPCVDLGFVFSPAGEVLRLQEQAA